jgi:peptidyl-prolyl cis-trans isomerase C
MKILSPQRKLGSSVSRHWMPAFAGMTPLAHFVVLGALLFGIKQLAPQPREVIEAPTLAVAQEEMLVREALRLGLERTDPIVRTRLTLNMRFLGGASGDDEALFEQALALGMPARDVVTRRRLAEAMRERFASGVEVGEADVRAYVEHNAARYGAPMHLSFEQRLADGAPFLLGSRFSGLSEADIARAFGPEFARQAMAAPVGRWSGPIRSPYGLHHVRVLAAVPAQAPDYAVVRRQARYALLAEREQRAADDAIRALQRRYELRVGSQTMASAQ